MRIIVCGSPITNWHLKKQSDLLSSWMSSQSSPVQSSQSSPVQSSPVQSVQSSPVQHLCEGGCREIIFDMFTSSKLTSLSSSVDKLTWHLVSFLCVCVTGSSNLMQRDKTKGSFCEKMNGMKPLHHVQVFRRWAPACSVSCRWKVHECYVTSSPELVSL